MPETMTPSSTDRDATSAQVRADLEEQRKQADRRTRPDLESQRRRAQQDAEGTLDKEAIAAIQQTERALNAIAENRADEALAAIEQATGKITVLLSRNPATALIPVNMQVTVYDTAPHDIDDINFIKDAADIAMDMNELPSVRTLLDALRSEIRVRTYHLPLETYPTALREAARLLDQKRTREAGAILLVALNTLVAIDNVTPIPLLLAKEAISEAQSRAQTDKEAARSLLEVADNELERTLKLGYTSADSEYKALRDEISNLRKQLKGNEDTGSVFARLKERLAAFTQRRSKKETRSDAKDQPRKAA